MDIVSDTDPVISSEQMKANQNLFEAFGAKAKFINIETPHIWPYVDEGKGRPKCERGKIYHSNCDYDFTGELLKHLYYNIP